MSKKYNKLMKMIHIAGEKIHKNFREDMAFDNIKSH